MAKKFDELDFTDAFMFGKVMEDPKLCHDFLSTLIGHDVGILTTVEREKEIRITSDGKPIRLDICTKDTLDNVYDAEMQNLNHDTVKSLELPKRTRFYQSVIDNDILTKGVHYSNLAESTIIFICTFDPFGYEKYLYSFREICEQDYNLLLNDGTRILFFNASVINTADTSVIEDIPENIRKLFEYIMQRKVSDDLTNEIEASVKRLGRSNRLRGEYMREISILMDAKLEGYNKGMEEGIEKGIEKGINLERANTKRAQKQADDANKRADVAKRAADAAEARIKELEALLSSQ